MQADFLMEVAASLKGKVHIAIQTCGYAPTEKFLKVLSVVDYVMYDLKVMDRALAARYTGCDNRLILENFQKLSESGVPFVVRVPLIPGVTDTVENLSEIAERVQQSAALGVELLPYNKMAGSKYALIGKAYDTLFDEKREPNIDTAIFCEKGIAVKVM